MSSPELKSVRLVSCGKWVSDNVVTNQDITDDLIRQGLPFFTNEAVIEKTGIEQRYISPISTAEMAIRAGREALYNSGVKPKHVDGVWVATTTSDYKVSATATMVAAELGIEDAWALDGNAGCTGFVYGATFCTRMIEAGQNKCILVIGADRLSTVTNLRDRLTRYLFADGAGAAVFVADDRELTRMHADLGADGKNPSLLYAPGGGSRDPLTIDKLIYITSLAQQAKTDAEQEYLNQKINKLIADHTIHMKGRDVFNKAVMGMRDSTQKTLAKAEISLEEIDWLIPHQANRLIIDTLISPEVLNFNPQKVIINIQKYGNTSAASIPIAMAEAIQDGRIKKGERFLWDGFGAGLTWGSLTGIYDEQAA